MKVTLEILEKYLLTKLLQTVDPEVVAVISIGFRMDESNSAVASKKRSFKEKLCGCYSVEDIQECLSETRSKSLHLLYSFELREDLVPSSFYAKLPNPSCLTEKTICKLRHKSRGSESEGRLSKAFLREETSRRDTLLLESDTHQPLGPRDEYTVYDSMNLYENSLFGGFSRVGKQSPVKRDSGPRSPQKSPMKKISDFRDAVKIIKETKSVAHKIDPSKIKSLIPKNDSSKNSGEGLVTAHDENKQQNSGLVPKPQLETPKTATLEPKYEAGLQLLYQKINSLN